jgi:hypothetical protein
MSFIVGENDASPPDGRIVRIGNDPVVYDPLYHDHVLRVGGKVVTYGIYGILGNATRITKIGNEHVTYSLSAAITRIGDRPVKSSWWDGRIISIGDDLVEYGAYPLTNPAPLRFQLAGLATIIGIVAIGLFFSALK